jgi:hypothetical protein
MLEQLKDIWTAVCKFFEPVIGFVAHNMPQLLVVAAAAVLAASYIWPNETWHEKALPYALAVLGAGFFTYLTKSALFRGLLRQELRELLASDDHRTMIGSAFSQQAEHGVLRRVLNEDMSKLICGPASLLDRKNLLPIFENVAMASGLPKAIAAIACEDLFKKMWDPAKPFYYSGLTRDHTLEWVDYDKGVLRVTTKVTGTLFNAIPKTAFTRRHSVAADPKSKVSSAPATKHCVLTSIATGKRHESSYQPDKDNPFVWINETPLPGDESFRLDEEWTYNIDVDDDNVIACETPVFVIKGLWVILNYDPDQMRVILSPIGKGAEFGTVSEQRPGAERRELPNLTAPGGGYIVTVQRARGSTK